MQKASIFNRNFRLLFNQNKYQNLTAQKDHTQTHLGWVSPVDYRFGRTMLYLTCAIGFFCAYMDPGVLHEAFGHFKQPPRYVLGFGKGLDGEEKKLNEQILDRHHAEEQLEHFKHNITQYDGK
ncbi:unnamed protein product [Paramecium octaurelia]|uniref:Uncharacterized protein n=1 Tax=Paramecium octaurelia TaxID=43137 RepID=A0A8S1YD49_PAROT|nr:unnamed protein product [Paramecium octaurelia]